MDGLALCDSQLKQIHLQHSPPPLLYKQHLCPSNTRCGLCQFLHHGFQWCILYLVQLRAICAVLYFGLE